MCINISHSTLYVVFRAGLSAVCPYLRMSVRPQKVFPISTKFSVLVGPRVLHDGVLYDPIQGQGHGGPKVAKMADVNVYLLRQYESKN